MNTLFSPRGLLRPHLNTRTLHLPNLIRTSKTPPPLNNPHPRSRPYATNPKPSEPSYLSRLRRIFFTSRKTLSRPPIPKPKPYTLPLSPPARHLLSTIKFLAAAHLAWVYILHSGATEGPSMLPTIPAHGAYVLILALHRLGRGIEVGDVVCFRNPVRKGDAVKRVLGLEGDYVLWDPPTSEPPPANLISYLREIQEGGDGLEERDMIQVPKGHVWVCGDNLTASRDSRVYGPIPLGLIKGKVIAQWLPWNERQLYRNPITDETVLDSWKKIPQLLRL